MTRHLVRRLIIVAVGVLTAVVLALAGPVASHADGAHWGLPSVTAADRAGQPELTLCLWCHIWR